MAKNKLRSPHLRTVRPSPLVDTRVVYCGDNILELQRLPDRCVDLIYIDPPFNSNRDHEVIWGEQQELRSFRDRHVSTQSYLDFMRPRCEQLARVLKQTGTFYYHCDWHASHYIKIMLDDIFGEKYFQNEIIWRRTTSHADTHGFGHVHDTIFRYSKAKHPVFNAEYKLYDRAYLKKYFIYADKHVSERGRHWRDNLTGAGLRNGETGKPWRGFDPSRIGKGRHWIRKPEALDLLVEDDRIYFPPLGGMPKLKRYELELKGLPVDSIWEDVPSLGGLSKAAKETIGYPTQKPLGLLERIIKASSNPGDIILDAFCGCGTALVAAESLGRQWIGVDISPTACTVMGKRLRNCCRLRDDEGLWRNGKGFIIRNLPWTPERLRELPYSEFEDWAVIAIGGQPNRKKVGDMGIDGRLQVISSAGKPKGQLDFDFMKDEWYPVQVKQKERVGREDIDKFETAIRRSGRNTGYIVAFGFTDGALIEVGRFKQDEKATIVPMTVEEILRQPWQGVAPIRTSA